MARLLQRIVGRTLLFCLRPFAKRKLPPQPTAEIRRIMVFRFGGIGDCIAVTALLRSLRLRWPEAHIAVATAPACRAVLEGNPDIDEILLGEQAAATSNPARLIARIRALRRWSEPGYDLAFFTHNLFSHLALATFFRARFKVGFDTNDRGFDFALTHSVPLYGRDHAKYASQSGRHFIEHFHDLMRAFTGERLAAAAARIALRADESREAAAWLAANRLARPLVVLAPGGTVAIKIWPIERFAAVARRCAEELGAAVVVIGGADEARLARAFEGLGPRVRFAAGALTLRQSMAIVGEADALVGSDTGLMHAGAALGVKLVTLFGPTPSGIYGYEGDGRVIVKAALDCVPCGSESCRLMPGAAPGTVPPCLEPITPDDVLHALRQVLPQDARAASLR